jgi:hypothetical protein
MAEFERNEYKFPDEIDKKASARDEDEDQDIRIEIEDDTPPEDRGRKPLPKAILEEIEQDELDEYSGKAKERLFQMRKVWHDERREKEAALREQQEAIRIAQQILEENKMLKSTLASGEKEYISTVQYAADTELEMAKRNFREAHDSGDPDKLMEAQQALTEATLRVDKTKNYRPTLQNAENDIKLPQMNQAVSKPPPDPKYVDWRERNNSWFQKDKEMTQAAFGLHEKLADQYGPEYIGTDDYYQRMDKTMRKRFPEAFRDEDTEEADSRPQRKASTVVASAKRSTAPKSIRLTTSQIALAKKLRLTPEQYAREVLKLENR